MEYFKQGLEACLSCQISTLEAISNNKAVGNLSPELTHFLKTTLVLSDLGPQGPYRRISPQKIVGFLNRNRFRGELDNLLKQNGLIDVWSEALNNKTVLVADPQVTYYVQMSGPPLYQQKSTLHYVARAVKKIQFSENVNEGQDRLEKANNIIIERFGLTSEKACVELSELRNYFTTDKANFLRKTLPFWWESVTPEIRVLLSRNVFVEGHPVVRALANLLNTKANTIFLRMQFGDHSEIPTDLIVMGAIALQRRVLPKNLLFTRTASRMESFLRLLLQTLIDYGSGAEFRRRLSVSSAKIPRWLKRIEGLSEQAKLVESLCCLIMRLIVLNVHAAVVVTNRRSMPKVAIYGSSEQFRNNRKRCLEELIRDNLEPSSGCPIGNIRPFPKLNPLKFRPMLNQFPEMVSFSKTARTYIEAIKARAYTRLRGPICRLNTSLALQRLSAIASKGSLYIVRADVKDCYGSVNHADLKEIIERRWPTGQQALQFKEVDIPLKPMLKARIINILQEHVFAWPLLEGRVSILVPTDRTIYLKGSEEKARLLHTIDNFIVSLDNRCYRFVRGLPQGASPSSFLADLYLTYTVDVLFERFNSLNCNSAVDNLVVFRTMDDYLVITNRLDNARRARVIFENEMHHPGLQFSKSKLMLNWKPGNNDATPENDVIPLTISYCGVEIDCTSGAVRPSKDYKTFLHDCRCYYKELHFKPPVQALSYLLATSSWAYSLGLFHFNNHNLSSLFRNMFEIAVESSVRFRKNI
ncbi:uncharacterized protein LOC111244710 isoform X2 [Varroa destructor]|uniref:Telomerase reverse transcriptase n=1 Tax=Varroa destructor TaxID=109461 RepID=A0A7M7JHF7_VARDE|nr:uncharacterized protein LOC111244710 isoform X2 [Varroa destructor]